MSQGDADNALSISNVQSDDGHDRIEYDASLTFATYEQLTNAVVAYATSHCFEIRLKTGSAITSDNHHGWFKCWCFQSPPNINQPLPIDTTGRKRKRKRAKSVSKEHAMAVGCKWELSFRKKQFSPHQYYIYQRNMTHTGHTPNITADREINSLKNITDAMRVQLTKLLSIHKSESEAKDIMEAAFKVTFTKSTFHNFYHSEKRQNAAFDRKDFQHLFAWLYKERGFKGASAEFYCVDTDIRGTFYMSGDMRHNLIRNGDVIDMDTTMSTNRFKMPLCILCGIDQNFRTVIFAIALIERQDADSFKWIFNLLKQYGGNDILLKVKTIMTGGDAAMANAIAEEFPDVQHLRCWYHIGTNMRDNLKAAFTHENIDFEVFLRAWTGVVACSSVEDFNAAKIKLHSDYPLAVTYLSANIWPNERMIADCFAMKSCTLGIRSTQRVEGVNAKMKAMLYAGSRTPLTELFDRFRIAAMDTDERGVDDYLQVANEMPVRANNNTAEGLLETHFTIYAAQFIKREYDRVHSYTAVADVTPYTWKVTNNSAINLPDRTVVVSATTMECSCNIPSAHLLPCRHVLIANHTNSHTNKQMFVITQVAQRWLKDYVPSELLSQTIQSLSNAPAPIVNNYQPMHLVAPVKVNTVDRRENVIRNISDDIIKFGGGKKTPLFDRVAQDMRRILYYVQNNSVANNNAGPADIDHIIASQPHANFSGTTIHDIKTPEYAVGQKGRPAKDKRIRSRGELKK